MPKTRTSKPIAYAHKILAHFNGAAAGTAYAGMPSPVIWRGSHTNTRRHAAPGNSQGRHRHTDRHTRSTTGYGHNGRSTGRILAHPRPGG